MGDLINRSFKFEGKRSLSFDKSKFTRSNTSWLESEMGSARFTTYEKLNDSIDNPGHRRAWRFLTKIFSLKKAGGGSSATPASVRSSSWRPDRNSRWPVQGW
ncbi:hypothetical protein R6Q57_026464 [Mikania cordata]